MKMEYYAACPVCGYKLLKGNNGTNVEVPCRKCGRLIRVHIVDGKISVCVSDGNKPSRSNEGAPSASGGSFSLSNQQLLTDIRHND